MTDAPTPNQPFRTRSGLPVGDLPHAGPVTVERPVPRTALAIGAHPDDIEFGAGATLTRWAAHGCRVVHLVLTDGSKGTWDPTANLDELIAARAAECLQAASVVDGGRLGFDGRVQFLGRIDGELANDASARSDLVAVLRRVQPNIVLTHDPWRRYRLHPDHRAAGFLTLDAVVAARDPHFFPELGLPPHRPDAILLWEADVPNHVEPASGYVEAKVDALWCHHSQLESTMGTPAGGGSTEDERVAAKAQLRDQVQWQLDQHGSLAGIGPGEAFHLIDEV